MGSGRNIINILTSRMVVACGMGPGTASEVSLAIKEKKKIILIHAGQKAEDFFMTLG